MKNKANLLMAASIMFLGFISPVTPTASAAPPPFQQDWATYSELSARWWQWLLSIPAAVNPNLDATGDNCSQGQYDDVWFLAGSFGGVVTRTCTIPAGKPIFFPVVNSLNLKPYGYETLLDLRREGAAFIDTVTSTCLVDSVDCVVYRVRSPSFTVIAPKKGVLPPGWLSVPGNTDSLVSDGYWVLLSPFEKDGTTHTIHFTAGTFLDVTYHLTIE